MTQKRRKICPPGAHKRGVNHLFLSEISIQEQWYLPNAYRSLSVPIESTISKGFRLRNWLMLSPMKPFRSIADDDLCERAEPQTQILELPKVRTISPHSLRWNDWQHTACFRIVGQGSSCMRFRPLAGLGLQLGEDPRIFACYRTLNFVSDEQN